MTPQTALSITETLYGVVPKAVLCSVRGYQFGFKSELSERTRVLCDQAIEKILAWVNEEQE
jgi:Ni,Fe-hydrogenase maturation factor